MGFDWDFGNGQTSTDSLPGPVQYFTDTLYRTYTIRLISTNFCGSDTAEHDITVKPVDVKAFFNVPNLIGCEPYTVQFNNFATPGATVSWQFGDGNTSSEFNPVHTFLDPGIYTVIQKASSGCGFDAMFPGVLDETDPHIVFQGLILRAGDSGVRSGCRGSGRFFRLGFSLARQTSAGPIPAAPVFF